MGGSEARKPIAHKKQVSGNYRYRYKYKCWSTYTHTNTYYRRRYGIGRDRKSNKECANTFPGSEGAWGGGTFCLRIPAAA